MGGIHIFEKPCYREIRAMRGRVMRGLPVVPRLYQQMIWRIIPSIFICFTYVSLGMYNCDFFLVCLLGQLFP